MAHRREMFLGALAMVITDICVLAAPKLQAYAIRSIESGASLGTIFIYSFSVFGVIAFAGIFRYLWRMYYLAASMKIAYELRNTLFRKLLSLTPRFYSKYTTGDLMARATNDLEAVRMATGPAVIFGIDILILGLSAAVLVLVMDWKLALMTLVPAPFIALVVGYFDGLIHKVFQKVQEQFSLMSEKVRENVAGIRVIKTYTQEEAEIENFSSISNEYVKQNMKLWNIEGIFRPIVILFSSFSVIIIMVFGLDRVIHGRMDLGDFWAFNEYLWLIVWPMSGIGWIVGMLQRGTASMERISEIFDQVPEIQSPPHPVRLNQVRGQIEFNHVTFGFSGEAGPVLNDISFTVTKGEKCALIGRIGAGKSALIGLLLRFYDPDQGTIRLDGHDVKTLDLENLRQAFGFVPQETFLFSDSIRDNIGFGLDDGDLERVKAAASLSHMDREISRFPMQYDTVVGEKGVTLSGGQKQRVSIARALMVEPAIIVFDDSFSNLDSETEELVLKSLAGVWSGKTCLVVSHRISTIQGFDHIIVLDQGRIIEEGKHSELLSNKGFYWSLYQRQKLEEALSQ